MVWRAEGGTTSTQRTIITTRTNWHVRNGEARRPRKPQTYQLISSPCVERASHSVVKLFLFRGLFAGQSPEVLGFSLHLHSIPG